MAHRRLPGSTPGASTTLHHNERMAIERSDLHRMIDELPDDELPAARRLLERLRNQGDDPVQRAFDEAPIDDEPFSDEQRRDVEEALSEPGGSTSDELRRDLGLDDT
ncbi:MAG: hypothetical protein ACOCUS_05535 [Polyangiales bacterium]